jgi:hypothetical protein
VGSISIKSTIAGCVVYWYRVRGLYGPELLPMFTSKTLLPSIAAFDHQLFEPVQPGINGVHFTFSFIIICGLDVLLYCCSHLRVYCVVFASIRVNEATAFPAEKTAGATSIDYG